ncbi:type II toxin-antitoxin system mRNA interferase toxin, RelE/StbE family [Fructobacillus parabroussonetiae]|uniref:Type II toxin-antitoxin system mRNA interferase toxin, RelE/StbE family n=1 Tax=Fructobacillus parabroussonetiae TaxID=2713174 RepID=A0ABS5QW85_9LACO|nr:type II toxin-antitoxin system mRNA interferase toxin, RelE/StbE family [Fructobacillus parabroussonetiae]MBS9337459.1 type II toxin-antitoxin system mRNA interferase toxin, RelE/StbE family [Fructobacillus parabroussonetiae]
MKRFDYRLSEQAEKALKRYNRLDIGIVREILEVIEMLLESETLPNEFNSHFLNRKWYEYRECHIRTPAKGEQANDRNDILMIYRYRKDIHLLFIARIGSHSDLFSGTNQKKH